MVYKNSMVSLLLIVAMTLLTWTMMSYRSENVAVAQNTQLPDAFMEGVTSIVMNKQGKPRLILETPKLVHYAENDTTDLTTPHLTLYRKSPEPWFINSKYAKATQGTENVNFWEDVTIHHAADEKNPATLIKTTTLMVHPNKQTAETGDPITLIQPNTIIKATGMTADMNTGNINLLSQAKGEYLPDA